MSRTLSTLLATLLLPAFGPAAAQMSGQIGAQDGFQGAAEVGAQVYVRGVDARVEATPVTFGHTPEQLEALYQATGADLRHLGRAPRDAAPRDAYVGRTSAVVGPLAGVPPVLIGRPAKPAAARDGEPLEAAGFDERSSADPALANAWWLDELRIRQAWTLATGGGVVIADCDSGYFTAEADLASNLMVDLRRDFSDTSNPTRVHDGSFVSHGTAVAAIMVGVKDGVGTQGIAYKAKLVPLQNFNYDRQLDDADKEEATARCVLHALRIPQVKVIVVANQTDSGSSETFYGTREAVRAAIASGVVVVSNAGSLSRELTVERTYDTGSIIVGALRPNGRPSIFSNYGSRVTVSAFGEQIQTLYGPGGRIESFGGTTAATAQVGAAVALMLSANPSLTPAQVRSILVATRRVTSDNQSVGGLLDVYAAVSRAVSTRRDDRAVEEQAATRTAVIEALAD